MTSDKTATRRDLLLRGAGSYLDALTALEAFDQAVEDISRRAYSRHKDALLAATGLDDAGDLERHTSGDPLERWAEIGVCRGTTKRGGNGPCLYIYLRFDEDNDDTGEIRVRVWLDFPSKGFREEVYNQICRSNQRCRIKPSYGEIYYALVLETLFNPNDATSAPDETLDKLLSDWIGYCESIGGLKMSGR